MAGFHDDFYVNTNLRKFTQIRDLMQEFFLSNPGIFPLTRPAATVSPEGEVKCPFSLGGEGTNEGWPFGEGRVFHSYQHYQQGYAQPEECALTCCNFELSCRKRGGNFQEFA